MESDYYHHRQVNQHYSDENNKLFLNVLGVEMKRIFERYPTIKEQVDSTVFDIVNLDFMSEAINS